VNIVITNVYSYKNKGDAAIVIALVGEVQRVFPASDILIQTTDVQNDAGRYGVPISSSLLWLLLSSERERPLPIRLLRLIGRVAALLIYALTFRVLGKAPGWLLGSALRQYAAGIEAADLVIACGGGYLRTVDASAPSTILLAVTCLNFLMAHYLRRPVYLYSQSIGPVHGWLQRRILAFALSRVNLIESREDITTRFLAGFYLPTPRPYHRRPGLAPARPRHTGAG
jgi:colanic acid/amylovoran biosynthesis protein